MGWEALSGPRFQDLLCEYLTNTPTTDPTEDLLAFSQEMASKHTPDAAARAICDRLYGEVAYVPGVTSVHTPAADAWEGRSGVCQDFAHLAIGVPVRRRLRRDLVEKTDDHEERDRHGDDAPLPGRVARHRTNLLDGDPCSGQPGEADHDRNPVPRADLREATDRDDHPKTAHSAEGDGRSRGRCEVTMQTRKQPLDERSWPR